jgi:hypothetical protein
MITRPLERSSTGETMADDLLDKIPDWLKSLHHMENELRRAARQGLIFRWKEACENLSEARGAS